MALRLEDLDILHLRDSEPDHRYYGLWYHVQLAADAILTRAKLWPAMLASNMGTCLGSGWSTLHSGPC